MDTELREFLERGVGALEKIATDPVIEMETGPPVCPHCEKINPVIRVQEREETGPMVEYGVQAQCLHCNQPFYALPLQWFTSKSLEEIQRALTERAENGNS